MSAKIITEEEASRRDFLFMEVIRDILEALCKRGQHSFRRRYT